jgi:hypothetical protein
MTTITPTARARAKRFHELASYDEAAIYAVLDAAFIAHISYVIDGQPYATPTMYWRQGRSLYWHGSSASRMLRHQSGDVPVCVTVSIVDGLVLARSGFNHSINYRSVMAFGKARIVTDPTEKSRELDRSIDRLFPGRRGTLRPNSDQELKATTVITMEIDEAAAKIASGDPKDDEADYLATCWAGVIPIQQHIGTITPDAKLQAGIIFPDDLRCYAEGANLDDVLRDVARDLP